MFRFTIRDSLWLTVVVVMALGWRLHMDGIVAAHKEQERLNAVTVRANQEEIERLRAELLTCRVEVVGWKEKAKSQ